MPCPKVNNCGIGELYQIAMKKQTGLHDYKVLEDSLQLIRKYVCAGDSRECPFSRDSLSAQWPAGDDSGASESERGK